MNFQNKIAKTAPSIGDKIYIQSESIFPETIAGAILLAGLNEPPEIGPANNIIPVTTNPISNPEMFVNSFLEVTPNIVRVKKNVRISSITIDCNIPSLGRVTPKVLLSGNITESKRLAKKAPDIWAKI